MEPVSAPAPNIEEVVSRGHEPTRTRAANRGGAPEGMSKRIDNRPSQNKNLKDAWAALGMTTIYGTASPYHDPQGTDQHKEIMSITTPMQRICLPMALVGKSFTNCKGKHDALSTAEVEAVTSAGGLDGKG